MPSESNVICTQGSICACFVRWERRAGPEPWAPDMWCPSQPVVYNAAERLIDREARDANRLLLDQASQQHGACCTMQGAWWLNTAISVHFFSNATHRSFMMCLFIIMSYFTNKSICLSHIMFWNRCAWQVGSFWLLYALPHTLWLIFERTPKITSMMVSFPWYHIVGLVLIFYRHSKLFSQ